MLKTRRNQMKAIVALSTLAVCTPLVQAAETRMIEIPAGKLERESQPPATVTSFRLANRELTRREYDTVRAWALEHGYDLGPGNAQGADYPASAITWYDAIKFCNAASELAGRTPVYYTSPKHDNVYRQSELALTEACVKADADGYRLPTKWEWVIPKKETVSALNSLWKYNFAPDAGQYAMDHVQIEQAFRWYAMPGEAGLLMTTWPKGGATEAIPGDRLRSKENPKVFTGSGGYFNECMNGFEYQVAAHMVYEGKPGSELVEKGLAVTKAVHERYGAAKRNTYNEIECSDHYARSMASYGIYLAACGFEGTASPGRNASATIHQKKSPDLPAELDFSGRGC